MLQAKLHGHLANKVNTENKSTPRTPSPSRAPASSKPEPKKSVKKDKGDYSEYNHLFRKYEMMMKIGINVHGAVGRMRQDGVDKAAIAAFERKHNGMYSFRISPYLVHYFRRQRKI